MIKDDCIFCKLANGIIPTNTIYEDDDFRVILDASPSGQGHSLIIPKQHFDNAYSIDDSVAAKVMPLAKKIALALKEEFNCDGINILQNNEVAAGQTVFHYHVHVIPRHKDDGINLIWKQLSFSDEEQKETAERIKARLDK